MNEKSTNYTIENGNFKVHELTQISRDKVFLRFFFRIRQRICFLHHVIAV